MTSETVQIIYFSSDLSWIQVKQKGLSARYHWHLCVLIGGVTLII